MALAASASRCEGGSGRKVVLISGVSKGLGRALALELAKRGHTIVGCSRHQSKLHSLTQLLSNLSPIPNNHFLFNAHVSSDTSVQELARAVVERKLIPDIIVNNAALINKNGAMWEVDAKEFDDVIDTNVKGVANVMRHFIPLMIPNNHGIIINMSSNAGRTPYPQIAAYCASKWAVEGLSKCVAKELGEGLLLAVVALDPGVIHTDMLSSFCGHSASQYQSPQQWAVKAATMILDLTMADNGASLTVKDPTELAAEAI